MLKSALFAVAGAAGKSLRTKQVARPRLGKNGDQHAGANSMGACELIPMGYVEPALAVCQGSRCLSHRLYTSAESRS